MIEEKLTDVQLALHVYRDVVQGFADQIVVCSKDSDLQPALQFVRRGCAEPWAVAASNCQLPHWRGEPCSVPRLRSTDSPYSDHQ
jgi:hypothetical protein